MQGRKSSQEASNQTAEVKPWGSGARADSTLSMRIFERPMFSEQMMEEVCERNNLQKALKRVISNKGSAGADGMTVEELPEHLRTHWTVIRSQLLEGKYHPGLIKRVEIPKPGSIEKRKLGIPNVLDRLIQQAVLQVMQTKWDPFFLTCSFGFRPGRSAHQAILRAQEFIQEGYSMVVDIDLEKFFDRINHDKLMGKLQASIPDKRVLRLIRKYLTAGILEDGLVSTPDEGSPQGGPLSPLLSNIVLDELDKELESRGHKVVRYADDCNVYVRSQRSGERAMASVTQFIEDKLKLKVNRAKSAVDKPQNRKFLGFSFTGGISPNRRKIAPQSLARFRAKVRALTRRNGGISLTEMVRRLSLYLRGWKGYFGFCEAQSILRDLDAWIRRRLRCVQWKQWKVYKKRKEELIRRKVDPNLAHTTAFSPKGPWKICQTPGVRKALPNKYFDSIGLIRLCSE